MRERRRLGKYLRGLMIAGDFLLLNFAYFTILWIFPENSHYGSKLVWLLVNMAFVPVSYFFSEMHNVRILYADRIVLGALKSSISEAVLLLAIFYIFEIRDIGIYYGFSFIILLFLYLSVWWVLSRALLKKLRRIGLNFKRVVVIGGGTTAQLACRELQGDAGYGYRLMGVFDNDKEKLKTFNCGFTAPLNSAAEFIVLNKIDTVLFTLDVEDDSFISEIMTAAEQNRALFVYVPKTNKHFTGSFSPTSVGMLPAMERISSPLAYRGNRLMKRVFDILFSGIFLLVSPIVFLPIALAVKLSSRGPVFLNKNVLEFMAANFGVISFAPCV